MENWGPFRWGCAAITALVLVLLLSFGVGIATGLMQLPFMNINRIVTQHSLAYVQSHQTQLMAWYSDYQSGDPAHQAAAKTEICTNYVLLDPPDRPVQIQSFVSQNC